MNPKYLGTSIFGSSLRKVNGNVYSGRIPVINPVFMKSRFELHLHLKPSLFEIKIFDGRTGKGVLFLRCCRFWGGKDRQQSHNLKCPLKAPQLPRTLIRTTPCPPSPLLARVSLVTRSASFLMPSTCSSKNSSRKYAMWPAPGSRSSPFRARS